MKGLARISQLTAAFVLISLAWQPARAAQYTDPAIGYSFTYPDDWMVESFPDGGVTVRNFRAFLRGGSPPMGGAEIAVFSYPPYPSWWPPDTDEYQWLENFGRRFTVVVHPSRSTPGPARLVFTVATPSGSVDTNEELVLRKGGRLFRIGLYYQAEDPNSSAYEQILSAVINSLAFLTQPTATPPTATSVPTPATTPCPEARP